MNKVQAANIVIHEMDTNYVHELIAIYIIEAAWTLAKAGEKIPAIENKIFMTLCNIVTAIAQGDTEQCFAIIDKQQNNEERLWLLARCESLMSQNWAELYYKKIKNENLNYFNIDILPHYLVLEQPDLCIQLLKKLTNAYGSKGPNYRTVNATIQSLLSLIDNKKGYIQFEKRWLAIEPNHDKFHFAEEEWYTGELKRLSRLDINRAKHSIIEIESNYGWDSVERGVYDVLKRLPFDDAFKMALEPKDVYQRVSRIQGLFEDNGAPEDNRKVLDKLMKATIDKKLHPRTRYMITVKLIYTIACCSDTERMKKLLELAGPPIWTVVETSWRPLRLLASKNKKKMQEIRDICLLPRKKGPAADDPPPIAPPWYSPLSGAPSPEDILVLRTEMDSEGPLWYI